MGLPGAVLAILSITVSCGGASAVRSPALDKPKVSPATERQRLLGAVGGFLMKAEALTWLIQGQALREARVILRSERARTLKLTGGSTQGEERLRQHLRMQRSAQLRGMAQRLIEMTDSGTSDLLRDTAKRLAVEPTTLLLDWLTYESALDFGMLTSVWRVRGNLRDTENRGLVASLFPGIKVGPDLARGVRVLSQDNHKLIVNLYGATIVEEIHPEPFKLTSRAATVAWTSNYETLRSIIRGTTETGIRLERLELRGTSFGVTYKTYLEEYLEKGFNLPWASLIGDGDPLALAAFLEEEAILQAAGVKRADMKQESGVSLEEMYPRLAPSAPVVETDSMTGSGFVVRYGGGLALATNRHVVKDAANGFRLRFLTAPGAPVGATGFVVTLQPQAVVAISKDADLALISLDSVSETLRRNGIEAINISDREPKVGEHVFAIGNPGTGSGSEVLSGTLAEGIVSAHRELPDQGRCVQVTVPINPGSSGGPLFDMRGEVVGVLTFTFRTGDKGIALEMLNFAVAASSLRALIAGSAPLLGKQAVAALVGWSRPRPRPDAASDAKFQTRLQSVLDKLTETRLRFYGEGLADSAQLLTMQPGKHEIVTFKSTSGESYLAVAVGDSASARVNIAIYDQSGAVLASDTDGKDVAVAQFDATAGGKPAIVVLNSGTGPVRVALVLTRGNTACQQAGNPCGESASGATCCAASVCVRGAVHDFYYCADSCSANSECKSGCCAPLSNAHERVCSASRFCGR